MKTETGCLAKLTSLFVFIFIHLFFLSGNSFIFTWFNVTDTIIVLTGKSKQILYLLDLCHRGTIIFWPKIKDTTLQIVRYYLMRYYFISTCHYKLLCRRMHHTFCTSRLHALYPVADLEGFLIKQSHPDTLLQ